MRVTHILNNRLVVEIVTVTAVPTVLHLGYLQYGVFFVQFLIIRSIVIQEHVIWLLVIIRVLSLYEVIVMDLWRQLLGFEFGRIRLLRHVWRLHLHQ